MSLLILHYSYSFRKTSTVFSYFWKLFRKTDRSLITNWLLPIISVLALGRVRHFAPLKLYPDGPMYVVTGTISLDDAILESLDWRLRCCYNNEIFILVTGEGAIKKWYPLYLHLAFQLSSLKHTRLFVTGWANFQHRGAFHLIAWPIRPEFLSLYQCQNLVCVSQISSEKEPHSNFIYIFRLDICPKLKHFVLHSTFWLVRVNEKRPLTAWRYTYIYQWENNTSIRFIRCYTKNRFHIYKMANKKILDLFNLLDPVKCHAVLKSKPITA